MLLQIPKSHPQPPPLLWLHKDVYRNCHKSDHFSRI